MHIVSVIDIAQNAINDVSIDLILWSLYAHRQIQTLHAQYCYSSEK